MAVNSVATLNPSTSRRNGAVSYVAGKAVALLITALRASWMTASFLPGLVEALALLVGHVHRPRQQRLEGGEAVLDGLDLLRGEIEAHFASSHSALPVGTVPFQTTHGRGSFQSKGCPATEVFHVTARRSWANPTTIPGQPATRKSQKPPTRGLPPAAQSATTAGKPRTAYAEH